MATSVHVGGRYGTPNAIFNPVRGGLPFGVRPMVDIGIRAEDLSVPIQGAGRCATDRGIQPDQRRPNNLITE
jgi:hypothetical protein